MGRGEAEEMLAEAEELESRATALREKAGAKQARAHKSEVEAGSVPDNILYVLKRSAETGYSRLGRTSHLNERDIAAALDRVFGVQLSSGMLKIYLNQMLGEGLIKQVKASPTQGAGWRAV